MSLLSLMLNSLLIKIFVTLYVASIAYSENKPLVFHALGGYQSFQPCIEHFDFIMYRLTGGHPDTENYWQGSLTFTKWSKLNRVIVSIKFDNPATVQLGPEVGKLFQQNNTFHIQTFLNPPDLQQLKFFVLGESGGAFPNIEQLKLNGKSICKAPAKWMPLLYGYNAEQAVIEKPAQTIQLCGKRLQKHKGTILLGSDTSEGDWPWHAALYYKTNLLDLNYKCGGTLINNYHIITAAHCVVEKDQTVNPSRLIIHLGKYQLSSTVTTNTQTFQVTKVMSHENFTDADLANDIAILRLKGKAIFTNYVQPICLWTKSKTSINNVIGKPGIAVGWGFNEHNEISDFLKQATMPIVSLTTCLSSNREFFSKYLRDKNFCAGYKNGTSVCNGDSGGGLFFQEDNSYMIRGLVSLSSTRNPTDIVKLCDNFEYVVFTDVALYLDWIDNAIKST